MQALEENMRKSREANERNDHLLRAQANLEFHKLLTNASKNPILVVMTNALVEMVREFLQVLGAMTNDYVLASREHMLKHLSRRDTAAAAEEAERYLEWTQAIYFERMGKAAAPAEGRKDPPAV